MKLPFYRTPERRELLLSEAQSWLDTPFRENGNVRGRDGGVDCANYLAAVHAATGACPVLQLEVLPIEVVTSWHDHYAVSRVLEFFKMPELRGRIVRVDDGDASMVGDIAVFKVGKTEHHLALDCRFHLYHVARPAGVVRVNWRDRSIANRISAHYRIVEEVSA